MSFRFWFCLLIALATVFLGLDRIGGELGGLPGWVRAVSGLAWPVCLLGALASLLALLLGLAPPRHKIKQLQEADAFRMLPGLAMAVCFLAWVAAYAPAQLVVLVFRVGAICLTGYVAYWMYRTWLPHFRPSCFLARPWRETRGSGIQITEGQMVPFVVSGACEVAFVALCMIAVAVSL